MSAPRVRVRAWTWDRGKPTAVPGAVIYSGPARAFVPAAQLRRIADQLHDHADRLEDQEVDQ